MTPTIVARLLAGAGLFLAAGWQVVRSQAPASALRFAYEPIDFTLESCETPERHAPETMAGGVAVFDYNNDGAPDIFFTNGADIRSLKKSSPKYSNRLFKNDGKGHFQDVTEAAGLAGTGYDTGVAIGDFDNDGYEDIFVGGVHRNTLYRNNGNGTFTDITAKAGLNKPDPEYGPLWSVGGAWVDVNNDGLLDLIVVNYLRWNIDTEPACMDAKHRDYCHPKMYKPTPNQVYLNNGDGTFRDISLASGIRAHPGKGMGIGVADYDLDGRMDFFVANDKMYNSLFHNKGDGKFEEVAFDANVALRENAELISGMGVDFRDLDNDGYPDIAMVALDDETFPIFRNTAKGEFADLTDKSRMAALSMSMSGYSPTIFDFDNDGWKDVFVTRGHVQSLQAAPRVTVAQPNTVFRNLGGNPGGGGIRFEALTAGAGLAVQPPQRHRGSAVADFDGDGRLDVVVTALGAQAEIWMNRSPGGNHWIDVKLEGTKSNRDAIGARVKLVTKSGTQVNHATTTCGYASSSAGPIHFGLGADTAIDLVEIQWPSGQVQQLKNVMSDRLLRVKER